MNKATSTPSVFNWKGKPSIFITDRKFNGGSDQNARAAQEGIKTGKINGSLGVLGKGDKKAGARTTTRRYMTKDQDTA